MKKIISLFLVFALVFVFAACGENTKKSIIGKWYNANNTYLEVLSDNTYIMGEDISDSDDIIITGEWKYLEKEEFYKFTVHKETSFLKIEIESDEYGTYIEFGEYGNFYKNKFPEKLRNKLELKDEEKYITCPNFVGMKLTDIKNNTEYTDKFIFTEKWDENDEYDYGYVFGQSIKEGSKVKEDAKITVYVSMGQSTERVPDLAGELESYAVSQLKTRGFVTKIVEEASDEYEAGYVIRTEPLNTTVVKKGETITIFVSTGKP